MKHPLAEQLGALAAAAAFMCALPSVVAADRHVTPKFAELSTADLARLDRQRGLIADSMKRHYRVQSLTRTRADLPNLQRLLDDHVFAKTQTYELQSLGVVFGDIVAGELGLRWMMVTDEYGTDPTLRLEKTLIQLNALTMISKRVERGDAVDLRALLAGTREALAKTRAELR